MTRSPLLLEVHICDQRRSILVTFYPGTDAAAADYVAARRSYCAMAVVDHEGNDAPYDYAVWPKLAAVLDPQCEHGLSASLCYGPNHYMSAEQERNMGWEFSEDYRTEMFSPAECD